MEFHPEKGRKKEEKSVYTSMYTGRNRHRLTLHYVQVNLRLDILILLRWQTVYHVKGHFLSECGALAGTWLGGKQFPLS